MKEKLLFILFGILCSLLAVGAIFLIGRPPRGSAIRLLPAPTSRLWVVQVSGEVVQPGVYELSPGSRVGDAVQEAGGVTADANTNGINLAAPLADGVNVVIPSKFPTPAAQPTRPAPTSEPATRGGSPLSTPFLLTSTPEPPALASTAFVNINTATLEELDQLPGIGPELAQRIIEYRTVQGLFTAIEDIMNVQGIGPLTFEKLKGSITVEP